MYPNRKCTPKTLCLSVLSLQKRPAAGGGKKAYDYLKLYRTNKILCYIPFRKDLQAEAERKKQNRKDSDPPGKLSNRWATCSEGNGMMIILSLHFYFY